MCLCQPVVHVAFSSFNDVAERLFCEIMIYFFCAIGRYLHLYSSDSDINKRARLDGLIYSTPASGDCQVSPSLCTLLLFSVHLVKLWFLMLRWGLYQKCFLSSPALSLFVKISAIFFWWCPNCSTAGEPIDRSLALCVLLINWWFWVLR